MRLTRRGDFAVFNAGEPSALAVRLSEITRVACTISDWDGKSPALVVFHGVQVVWSLRFGGDSPEKAQATRDLAFTKVMDLLDPKVPADGAYR